MTSTESTAFVRLIDLPKELFEFDKAELDFGIYRETMVHLILEDCSQA